MTFQESLSHYADRSSALIDDSPQMDEQNTKRKIIEPLIELLGWDILSSEVELEYSVQMGSGTKKVDYALKIEDTPVVFVEAKGCDTTLIESHQSQLKSYMRQVGVDWGLLSNGQGFEIFRRDQTSTRPNEISLANFLLEDIVENRHPLKALSKESIDTGESRQIAEKIESVQKAVEKLQKNKESVVEEITGIVTQAIGQSVSQEVEDEAKKFVDNLSTSLDEKAHRDEERGTPEEPQPDTAEDYVIQLLQNDSIVHHISHSTQVEAMVALVNYLLEERELLQKIEIPYVPGTGRGTRALLNEEPIHTNGETMRQYKKLSNGYYLFTSLSAKDKIRYVSELPEKVGLECEFVGDW